MSQARRKSWNCVTMFWALKVPGSNTYCIQWHRRSQRMARNESMKTVISHGINLHQIRNIKKYQNLFLFAIYIYIYIYCMYVYIYIYIFVCKRSVHSMDCGQTTTVLFPSVYPLAIQHPGVVDSHHVSYVNHWTKWHCCQIARGFLHLRCGLCDDLGMQLPSLLFFLFQGKRSLKMNVPISNWAICRERYIYI